MALQSVVLNVSFSLLAAPQFHIDELRLSAMSWGLELSYKQARNALYRLRCSGVSLVHLGRGFYRWV